MGAPQKAITQSPMYLSMVPRWSARITRDNSVNSVFMSSPRAAGSIFSDKVVKPRTSANITVSSVDLADMVYWPGFSFISPTSSGGTYWPKSLFTAFLVRVSNR